MGNINRYAGMFNQKNVFVVTYPIPTCASIKILSGFASQENGEGYYPELSMRIFPGKNKNHNIDTFNNLVGNRLIIWSRKLGRRNLYKISESGHKLLEYAMQYKNVTDLLKMLKSASSYPEFKMNIVFESKSEYLEDKFFQENIMPIVNGTFLDKCRYAEVDHGRVVRHMKNMLDSTPLFKEYFTEMTSPKE